jgi:maltooligosyltrehalose synthase
MPLGAETWGNTEVMLRKQLRSGEYRDAFTGKTVSSVPRDGDFALPVAGAFAHLPIAMLVNVQSKVEGPTDVR